MKQCLSLFLTLAKISLMAFGGGYAILPILQRELVEKKLWLTQDDLGDIFAIAQCTPGVIAVNAATFVGARIGKARGAVCATLGVLTPPVIIILLVAVFLWPYLSHPVVQHAVQGLQVCVCALILHAVIRLIQDAVKDFTTLLLFLACLAVSFCTSISPAFLVLAAGLLGLALGKMRGGKAKC